MIKFAKIPIKDINAFVDIRKQNDAINKAITKAKSYGMSESECQTLTLKKLKIAQEYKDIKDKVMFGCIDSNLIDFGDNWYGILCSVNRKNELIVHPLVSNCLEEIQIDFNNSRLKPREEYDSIIKNNTDFESLNSYKNDVMRMRDSMLFEFLDCTDIIYKDDVCYNLTSHCMRRWNERIRHSKDKVTIETHEEIVNEIANAFEKSEYVYQGDDENSRFFMNKEYNIMFVVTIDNIIMTLWRNNFGFTNEEINRTATIMQLDNVIEYRKQYNEFKESQFEIISKLESDKEICKKSIFDIEEQIARLVDEKNEIKHSEREISQQINDVKSAINERHVNLLREENFIFKACKFVLSNE